MKWSFTAFIQSDQLNKSAGAYKIVITMDPRAVASQNTGVGWRSCMNLDSGMYRKYVGSGIAEGLFIAYLTRVGDEKELKSPTARVLIKPLRGELTKKIYWTVDQIYGSAPVEFKRQVQKIINRVNERAQDIFELPQAVYNDRNTQAIYANIKDINGMPDNIIKKAIRWKPELFKTLKDPSEDIQFYAVSQNGLELRHIKEPSNRVIEAAIERDGDAIQFVKNPTMKQKIMAVESSETAIKYIKNPSERIQLAAVDSDPDAFEFIDNPSERVILKAIEGNGAIIKQINNPTIKMMKTAIYDDADNITFIKKPPLEIIKYAIEQEWQVIRFIKNPSKEIIKLAIEESSGYAASPRYIKNLPLWAELLAIDISSGDIIADLKHPSEKAMMRALRYDLDNVVFLDRKMTPKVKAFYKKLKKEWMSDELG